MIIKSAVSISSVFLVANLAVANTASHPQLCEGLGCFTSVQSNVNPAALSQGQQYAWRPGYYQSGENRSQSNNYRRSSSSSSWFVSVPRKGPANSRGTFVFDPKRLTWAAYDASGDLVRSGRASGGMSYCADVGRSCLTPRGKFRVYRKGPANCVSSKYPLGEGGAPMPHCSYFHGGYAIHGSYHVPRYNASHGCIRVVPREARWLHGNFIKVGTVVHVKSY